MRKGRLRRETPSHAGERVCATCSRSRALGTHHPLRTRPRTAQPQPQPKASERAAMGLPSPIQDPQAAPSLGSQPPAQPSPSSQQSPRGLHSSLAYKPLTGLRVDPGMPSAASNTGSPGAALRLVCKQDRGRPPSWLLDDQVLCMCGDCPFPLVSESSAVAVVGEGSADPLRPAPHRILSNKLRQRDRGHPPPPTGGACLTAQSTQEHSVQKRNPSQVGEAEAKKGHVPGPPDSPICRLTSGLSCSE